MHHTGPSTCRVGNRKIDAKGDVQDLPAIEGGSAPGRESSAAMRRLCAALRDARTDKGGVVALMVAVATPVLIGFAGLAIDVAAWEGMKSAMQGAADRAALAAGTASQRSGGDAAARVTEARSVAASHGFVHGKENVQVNLDAPKTGSFVSTAGALEVSISGPATLGFTKLFMQTAPTVTGRAVVVPGNMCVLALHSSGVTVSTSGNAALEMSGCDIYNNSPAGNSTDQQGSGRIKADNFNLVGGASGNVIGNKVTGVRPALDPYADRTMPTKAACDQTRLTANSSMSVAPGPSGIYKFCKGLSLKQSGTLTFAKGIYIIEDGLDLVGGNWTLTGTGVTLVFTGNMNGKGAITGTNPTIRLTAPNTGDTAGIGIWVDGAASGGDIKFTGGATFSVVGAVYAPNAKVHLNGHAGSTCMQLVVRELEMGGTSNLRHECKNVGVSDVPGSFRLVE